MNLILKHIELTSESLSTFKALQEKVLAKTDDLSVWNEDEFDARLWALAKHQPECQYLMQDMFHTISDFEALLIDVRTPVSRIPFLQETLENCRDGIRVSIRNSDYPKPQYIYTP